MKKIKFEDLPSENTPIISANLNGMQDNIEESAVIVSSTEPTSKEKVWFQKSNNLFDINNQYKFGQSFEQLGLKVTYNDDYSITINGVATGQGDMNIVPKEYSLNLNKDIYVYIDYMSGSINRVPSFGFQQVLSDGTNDWSANAYLRSNKVEPQLIKINPKTVLCKWFRIVVNKGHTYNNYRFRIMISKNKPIDYEPYTSSKILTKTNGVFEEFYNKENKENYSLAEQRIGTWINGKPLYRKVIEKEFPEIQDGVEETLEITLNGINFVIVESYWAERTYEKILNQGPYPNVIQQKYTSLSNNTIIRFSTTKSYLSNRKIMIIIKYTKATD